MENHSEEAGSWLDRIERRLEGTFWEHIGCSIVEVSPGRAVVELVAESFHLNSMGMVHGGVLATLLDNAMGLAALGAHPDRRSVTTNLNVHFVAPLGPGTLVATAAMLHASRSTVTLQASVADRSGKLGTVGTGSFRFVD